VAEDYREQLRRDWQPTAWLLAMIHNVNCTESRDRKMPDDYDVYAPKKKAGFRVPFKQQVAAIARQFRSADGEV